MNSEVTKAVKGVVRITLGLIVSLLALGTRVKTADAQVLFPNALVPFNGTPNAFAVGDVNSDGRLDVVTVTTNQVNQNVTNCPVRVALNKGNGTFAPYVEYTAAYQSNFVVVADVNGDGKPDIITDEISQYFTPAIIVLLNNGDGTFGQARQYFLDSIPNSCAVGDIDGDGKPDIVVTNYPNNTVSILRNIGNGGFAMGTIYSVGTGPISVALADFNGDGILDIVTANSNNTISVLLAGVFGIRSDYKTSGYPSSVAAADLDGDGKPDIVVTCETTTNTVNVFRNNGSGMFPTSVTYTSGNDPVAVAIADVNGDGKPDIITENSNFSDVNNVYQYATASVLLNNGNGTFAANKDYSLASTGNPPNIPIYPQSGSLVVADMNGDGKPDILSPLDGVSIQYNKGNGAFGSRTEYAAIGAPAAVIALDVNGDGKPDIINVCDRANNSSIEVLINNGDGTFAPSINYPVSQDPDAIVSADLNGDGSPDLIVSNLGTINVLLNDGKGHFTSRTDYGIGPDIDYYDSTNQDIAVADLNGDGKPDIVTVFGYGGYFSVFLNKGDGTFPTVVDYPFNGLSKGLALADVNGDGKPDLIMARLDPGIVSVQMNNGNGTFGPETDYPCAGSGLVLTADVNGDGKLDIIVISTVSVVYVLLNNGDGTFAPPTTYSIEPNAYSGAVGDVNGDGKPDIVVANTFDNTLSVLLNNGDGTFTLGSDYASGYSTRGIALADFNGDGRLDIATANRGGVSVSVLLNQGTGGNTASGVLTLDGIAASAAAQNLTFAFQPVGGGAVITKTAGVSPNGLFHFDGLPANAYNLRIKGNKYLASRVPVDLRGGSVSNITAALSGGDANNDNMVNAADFNLLINAYGSIGSDPATGYDFRADFNGDGAVDNLDFNILVGSYGNSGAP